MTSADSMSTNSHHCCRLLTSRCSVHRPTPPLHCRKLQDYQNAIPVCTASCKLLYPRPSLLLPQKVSWRGCEKTFIGVDVKEGLDGEQGGATPQKHTALSSSLFLQTRKHGPESVKEGVNGMRSHTSPRRSGYLPCLCLSFLVISGRKLSGK